MENQQQGRLHGWLALLANLGVVIGLVVLIVEIHQNAELTRLEIDTGKNELLASIEFSLAEPVQTDAWIKSYRNPEAMTETEIRQVESHLVAMLLQWDYMLQMESRGLVDAEEVRNHIANSSGPYFGSRFAKAWFEREMTHWQGTRMLEIAGPIVAELDPNYLRDNYSSLLEIAAKAGAEPD